MPDPKPSIACFGEVLWDCLPHGLFLGGAPLNVAYHCTQLGAHGFPISGIGDDRLGKLARQTVEQAGCDSQYIATHQTLETGLALATLDEDNNASYEIVQPAAWDEIKLSPEQRHEIINTDAIVYGTLAARSPQNRLLLENLLSQHHGLKVCDVNLRPPHDALDVARYYATHSDVVKLNDDELARISNADTDENSLRKTMQQTADELKLSSLVVTRGGDGAAWLHHGEYFTSKPEKSDAPIVDTIGAGDAFTAALICGLLAKNPPASILHDAVALGSYVATQSGAQPKHP